MTITTTTTATLPIDFEGIFSLKHLGTVLLAQKQRYTMDLNNF